MYFSIDFIFAIFVLALINFSSFSMLQFGFK
jgi:hypothetical protein